MKIRTLAMAAVTFGLVLVAAQISQSAITGSSHDFRGDTWYSGSTEICLPCHAPHNNEPSTVTEVLWNHERTAVATYTTYDSNSMDSSPGQPSGTSKLCLSCHDGTVALDSWGGSVSGNTDVMGDVNAGADVGSDLSNDHPITIDYTAAGTGLHPTTAATGIAVRPTIADMLDGNNVECSSCHAVHNEATLASLLWKSNDNSALCLTCHDK